MNSSIVPSVCAGIGLAAVLLVSCEGPDRGPSASGSAAVDVEVLSRGEYLADGLLQCLYCHSERNGDLPGGPIEGPPGIGRIHADDGEGRLVARNLTSDDETGIGLWTDAELERAIRSGISRDGRVLSTRMPYEYFRHLPDADLAAVIAYLRSLPPVRNPLPPTALSAARQLALDSRPPPVNDPIDLSPTDPVELGRSLVRLARCEGCHTGWEAPRNPGVFAGGNLFEDDQGTEVFSTNITSHASGMSYDAETFMVFMRTGRGETLHRIMPWTAFRNLSDRDLRALYAFLRTMLPVAHYINNTDEPTSCPVCGQTHGLGELNSPYELPAGIRLDPSELRRYVGVYYSSEWDWTLALSLTDGRLVAHVGEGHVSTEEGPRVDVVFLSRSRLQIPDEVALDVVFDEDGTAVRLTTLEAETDVLDRVGERVMADSLQQQR